VPVAAIQTVRGSTAGNRADPSSKAAAYRQRLGQNGPNVTPEAKRFTQTKVRAGAGGDPASP
jgi:hypothetical protein